MCANEGDVVLMWDAWEIRWLVKGTLIVVRFQTTVMQRCQQFQRSLLHRLDMTTLEGSQGSQPTTLYPTAPGCCWHCLVNHWGRAREKERSVLGGKHCEWIRSRSKLKISTEVTTPAGSAVRRCKGYRICCVTQVMFSHTHTSINNSSVSGICEHRKIPPWTHTHSLIYYRDTDALRERQPRWAFNSDGWRNAGSKALEKMDVCKQKEGISCFTDRREVSRSSQQMLWFPLIMHS